MKKFFAIVTGLIIGWTFFSVPTKASTTCKTEIVGAHVEFGGTCHSPEVMLGIYSPNPIEVWCGQVQVTCE